MTAAPTTKEDAGIQVKDENAEVSLDQALAALSRAQNLLDSSKKKSEEWHNPLELLDETAAALDEAALALKCYEFLPDQENDEETIMQVLLIQQLAESVVTSRNSILNASNQFMAGNKTWEGEGRSPKTLIVWATHTGTSKKFALSLKENVGVDEAMNIKDMHLAHLQKYQRVLFICSTFGCGRPPRDAEVLFSTLQLLGGKEGSISVLFGMEFAVAALGSSKFKTFCKFGYDLSDRLAKLGAKEIVPIAVLDTKNGKGAQKEAFLEWQNIILGLHGKPPVNESPKRRSGSIRGTDSTSKMEKCCVIS
jgi:sulfite reductase alpha subunit-like flavoprotein